MKAIDHISLFTVAFLLSATLAGSASAGDRVETANGVVEGTTEPDSGVRSFKGIPFAAPPVGDLRWKSPQPVKDWEGVRRADKFGPRAMQLPLFGDMVFPLRRDERGLPLLERVDAR
jgi:para-nitrobenzyl esterase